MAYYVLEYRYADPVKRAAARSEHLDYMHRLHAEGRVVLAGPVGDGGGALVVYRADDEAQARALIAEDPYTRNGVTTDLVLRAWSVVIGGAGDE